jgi:hypothetical protein
MTSNRAMGLKLMPNCHVHLPLL